MLSGRVFEHPLAHFQAGGPVCRFICTYLLLSNVEASADEKSTPNAPLICTSMYPGASMPPLQSMTVSACLVGRLWWRAGNAGGEEKNVEKCSCYFRECSLDTTTSHRIVAGQCKPARKYAMRGAARLPHEESDCISGSERINFSIHANSIRSPGYLSPIRVEPFLWVNNDAILNPEVVNHKIALRRL